MHWFFYHRMFSGHKYESYSIYDTIWCFPVICFKYIYKECDDVSKDMMIKVKKKRGSLSLCDINSCWCGSLLYVCPLLSELISLNLETKASFKWSRNRRRGSWWVPDFWVQLTHSRIWSHRLDRRVRSTAELPSLFSSLLLYICSILQRFRKHYLK